jgi:hypothetical protein
MLRRLAAGLCALALAAAATLPTTVPARAVSSCTGWTSNLVPPTTIKVYRTEGAAAGKVQTVDFRFYVEVVMANEWPASWTMHTLRAGAIAVKQYGWYRAMHYRGKTARNGDCYDVVDYWADQVYKPRGAIIYASLRQAVAETWGVSLRQFGGFFVTGYHAGEDVRCGSDDDGLERIYQWSSADCGKRGLTMDSILRTYYAPALSVVEPGAHHIVGTSTRFGDTAVLTSGSKAASFGVRLYRSKSGRGFAAPVISEFGLPRASILGAVSADVTGDDRDDLVILLKGSGDPPALSLYVLRSTGTGYATPQRWWYSSAGELIATGIDLLARDFDGDRRDDAALLVKDPSDGSRSILYLMRSTGGAFQTKRRHWSGYLNNNRTRAYGADVNGDGRADLVAEFDLGTGGLAYYVMASRQAGGELGKRIRWFTGTGLRRPTTQTIVGDADRDGRTDLLIAYPKGSAGSFLTLLRSKGTAFSERDVWISDTVPYEKLRIGGGDVTGDAHYDVVAYVDLDSGGTTIQALRGSSSSFPPAFSRTDSGLVWASEPLPLPY